MIHNLSDVSSANIGSGTSIWQFVVVGEGAVIGENCNICSHCYIESGAVIGNNVTIKCGVYLWDGIVIEDNVFVGPNTVFTNDKNPKSKNKKFLLEKTVVKENASIGAGSIVLPGITIGVGAMIGAGSLVTKNVNDGETVYGTPAKPQKVKR